MSTGEGVKGRKGRKIFYIYICGSLNVCRGGGGMGDVDMESVVFVVIHTTSVEYNNKVTVLRTGENCA